MFVPGTADDLRARSAPPATDRRTPTHRTLLGVRPVVSGGICAPTLLFERPVIADATMTALHAALTGLQQRSEVTANNIANVDTPGYLAGRVDFESTLRSELASGQPATGGQSTVSQSSDPTTMTGNNVNLDTETTIATETGLRYQLALNALDGKYSLLRSALRTQ
jgi:flagellar basal-body rod protein FlgB